MKCGPLEMCQGAQSKCLTQGNGAAETQAEKERGHKHFYLLHNFALGSTQGNMNGRDRTLKLQSIPNTLTGNYSIHCK